tara:strand:- start:295206 stop:295724 length:519 start_codon:yes stop_codon:yes gene_type:complete
MTMTKHLKLAPLALAALALAPLTLSVPTAAVAQTTNRVEVGVLNCAVKGGDGFIFGSTKDLSCEFTSADGGRPVETYFGVISKFGLDIGRTGQGVISWAVLAPTSDLDEPGALAGDYSGVSAEATVGAGLGANVLVGGSSETIALQPVSVSTQTGLNFALAVTQIELRSSQD